MDTLILPLLLIVPCAVLTAAGVLLWRRRRSAATAMIALGFAVIFLSLASSLFATYRTHAVLLDMTSARPAQQDTFFIVAHYHRFALLGILGMWVAAVGVLWLGLEQPRAVRHRSVR
jgi:heme/copper-type cytochrome/quinol oxidase subunit 1